MTLSFNKLNEIAELYESIAFSEQEQLNGEYIDEQGRPGSAAVRNQNVFKFPTSSAGTRRGAAAGTRTPASTSAPAKPAAPAPAAKPTAPAPAVRPATPTPAPKATTPAKPATPAPTSTSAKTSPTSTSTLKSATDAASKPSAFNPAPAPAPTAAPVVAKPVPKPAAPGAGRDYLMKRQLNQNFDVFDAVLGYLIDEGYADTEEAATAIMANMSEGWRESIVENRGMAYSGGKPGASGDGGKPTGITGGTTYQMKGWNDDAKDAKKPKVKGV